MKIEKIIVDGELIIEQDFDDINIILGGNKSGKTTFIKLILYGLGADFDDFIPEIKEFGKCESVTLNFSFKNINEKFQVVRRLPKSDVVILTDLTSGEQQLLSLDEYSTFLLNKNEFNISEIAYGENNKATLRFYFILRAMYIDQETPAYRLLADIGGREKDYINSVKQLKKEILRSLIYKVDFKKQKTILQLQYLNKKRKDVREKLTLTKDILKNQYSDISQKNIATIKHKIRELKRDIDNLKSQNHIEDFGIELAHDKSLIKELNSLEQQRIGILNEIQNKELNKIDMLKTQKVFESEFSILNEKDVVRDFITNIPILVCPACSSNLKDSDDGICRLCGQKIIEDNSENTLAYKRIIKESLTEITTLFDSFTSEINKLKASYNNLTKRIEKLRSAYLKDIDKDFVNKRINLIADKIAVASSAKEYWLSCWKLMLEVNLLQKNFDSLSEEIKTVSALILLLDNNEMVDIDETLESIASYINVKYKDIYNDAEKVYLDSDMMPIIGNKSLSEISSASEKIVIRLLVLLAFLKISTANNLKHPGVLFLDSPRDKDLDLTRYRKIIEIITGMTNAQIFFTGSIEDISQFPDNVLMKMIDGEKLLKPKKKKLTTD